MMKVFITLIILNMINSMKFWNKIMNFLIINLIFLKLLMMMKNNFLNFYWVKINYIYGMDYISFNLCMLTFWIMSLSMYANNNFINKNKFLNLMIMLTNILIMCFISMNMMIFYIFFEMSLIPIMIIIMGWGYQIDRIQASMYMLFYTLFGSLPLLIIMMYLYTKFNSLMFNMMWLINMNINFNNLMIFYMMITAFLIKMPMFIIHLWLPKAHVEAPVSGSMILAGIMLKLGSYGLYRSIFMIPNMTMKLNYFIIIFSLLGSFMASLICLNQNDLKIIVAYSSVVHMSLMISSMMMMMHMSMYGSLMMMIAHGLCSAGMFFLVNLNYERLKSRSTLINKGLINLMPPLTLWWFLMCTSNFSAPPSLNLFSEILLLNSIIQWNYYLIISIMLISFFSTSYSIFLYAYTQYGKMNYSFYNLKFITCRDYLLNFLMWMPLNLYFLLMMFLF